MDYLKSFEQHSDYELVKNGMPSPSVAYCENEKDVHYRKPYDAEVEYLIANGNQWIEIPSIKPSAVSDAMEMKFRTLTTGGSQYRFSTCVGQNVCQTYVNNSGRVAYCYANASWTDLLNSNGQTNVGSVYHSLKIDWKAKKATYDTCVFNMSGSNPATATNSLALLLKHSSSNQFKGWVYGYKFWRNNELMLDLIPVRKDGIGYMYDKLNGTMYGSSGTQNFSVSYDKFTSLSDYRIAEYIENTSTAATAPYINTGVSDMTGPIDMEMTVKWNTIDSSKRQLHGCANGCWWGCDGGTYVSTGVDSGVVPSTTEFEHVAMNTYNNTPSYQQVITLFRAEALARNNVQTDYISTCKIKDCQIRVAGALVRDFVAVQHPCGRYGLFDKVENKFYDSATGVAFGGA